MKKKRMTSWERRQRRRIQIVIAVSCLVVVAIAAVVLIFSSKPYETIILNELFDISYSGFNNSGQVHLSKNEEKVNAMIEDIKENYENAIFKKNSVEDEDYQRFADSIVAVPSQSGNLSNGTRIVVRYDYNSGLAEKLNIKVLSSESNVTVGGLQTAIRISKEELFKDLEVEFEGVSPDIKMTIKNNSSNPFVQNVAYNPIEYKESYSVGDVVTIRAYFNDNPESGSQYIVDTPSANCLKEYIVTGSDEYISSAAELPDYIVDQAVTQAKLAFTDANEYGVRIFCEAHLVPVYINKQATFRWLNPSLLSVYFKSVLPHAAEKDGNNYNDLDIVFNCKITQADGVTCNSEAVVRFSNIVKKADGTYEYDFSNPKLISASYSDSAIKQVVVGKYEGSYNIEKIR